MILQRRVLARERYDFVTAQRFHFALVRDAVAVPIVPECKPLQLAAAQLAIAVIVEGTQGIVAGIPEEPKCDVAKELQSRCHFAFCFGIMDEPSGLRGDSTPFAHEARTIGIECHLRVAGFEVCSLEIIEERNGDRRDGSRKPPQLCDSLLDLGDFIFVLFFIE